MNISSTKQIVSHVKETLSVVTRKGQVTVPVEIREALGIKQGDKIAFVLNGRNVYLTPSESVVARTAGMLRGKVPVFSRKKEKQAFEKAVADDVVKEL